ncbi:hypothetical protein ABH931_002582 [Streptacidiphilus sp. MAP12-33]|uniref:DUF2804 family protein n=1 Tax=Streptacidiphilus sp. MAP12-33 TaxID=3156266 RepID=UPI0035118EDE
MSDVASAHAVDLRAGPGQATGHARHTAPVVPAPHRLVEGGARHFGRFAARLVEANPLDAYTGRTRRLKALRLTPESASLCAPWRIASADGRLDVVFEPEGRKAVEHQLGVLAIDYFQLFGRYRCRLRDADGRTHEIAEAHGVCESMKARL